VKTNSPIPIHVSPQFETSAYQYIYTSSQPTKSKI